MGRFLDAANVEPPQEIESGQQTRSFFDARENDISAEVVQQEPENQEGFIERVGGRLGERNARMKNDFSELSRLEQGPLEAITNVSGELAGSFFDVVSEGVIEGASAITPDAIKEYASTEAVETFQGIINTDVGKAGLKALEGTVDLWREFKASNPKVARQIENIVNVSVLFAPVKVKKNAGPSVLSKTSDAVKAREVAQVAGSRRAFLEKLTGPKRDLKVLKDEVPRTTEKGFGPFKRSVVEPTKREAEIVKEVSKIKDVKPGNSIQGNYNVINAENKKLAKQLKIDVKEANVKIPQNRALQTLDDVIDEALETQMFLAGSGTAAAETMRLNASKILIKHTGKDGFIKGENLLAARKELDKLIRKQKEGIFNPEVAESAVEIVAKTVRNSMNDLLDDSIPLGKMLKLKGTREIPRTEALLKGPNKTLSVNLKVKTELKRQSLLFGALDNMVPKAALEANLAIARSLQNAMNVVPIRNEMVQLLAMSAGVGGLGAAAMAAPKVRAVGALTAAIYGVYKGVTAPVLKRTVAFSLKMIDKAITTTENQSMLKALRADRAVIMELSKRMAENETGFGEARKPVQTESEQ